MVTNPKEKQRIYDQARYQRNPERQQEKNRQQAKRIRSLIVEIKESRGGKCKRCGFAGSLAALVFHHRPGTEKRFAIANSVSGGYGAETVKAEVAKCDVICANCHMIEHFDKPL